MSIDASKYNLRITHLSNIWELC